MFHCGLATESPVLWSCDWQVWDGTKCRHPLLEVWVEPGVMEAAPALELWKGQELVANVLVYDNHVETARQLKVGPANTQTCTHCTHARQENKANRSSLFIRGLARLYLEMSIGQARHNAALSASASGGNVL